MYLQSLSLASFRNFVRVEEVGFPAEQLCLVHAPNATGKTNFLESIFMLLRGKSWRAPAAECVQWGQDYFRITGQVVRGDGPAQLTVRYQSAQRLLRLEEAGAVVSLVTLYTRYPVVLFLPEDTFLFTRGPEGRRNFLNSVLVSSPQYLASLVQYHRTLRQRNSLLKQATSYAAVASWSTLLNDYAHTVWQQREALIAFIETHLSAVYAELTGEDRVFAVLLSRSGMPDTLLDLLQTHFSTEQRAGYTLWGPHRDDIGITTQGRSVREVLSQGQMRSLVIALKMVSHTFLTHITGEQPIILLDEVLSELDEDRQRIFLTHLPATQIIMTATSLPSILHHRDDVSLLDLRTILRPTAAATVAEPKPRAVAVS